MSKKLKMIKFAQSVDIDSRQTNHASPGELEKIGATVEVDEAGITIIEKNGSETRVFGANICYIKYVKSEEPKAEAKPESKSKSK